MWGLLCIYWMYILYYTYGDEVYKRIVMRIDWSDDILKIC